MDNYRIASLSIFNCSFSIDNIMLKNYFKIATKLLWRNKLYTFISLFGIVFTLLVLMLVTSVLESELGKRPPLSNRDRILFIPIMRAEGFQRITDIQIDTTYVDGIQQIDSTSTTTVNENKVNWLIASGIGYDFYKDKIKKMKSPAKSTAFVSETMEVYPDGEKLSFKGNMTDTNFWEMFDYQFKEGGPFSPEMVDNQANVMILRESAAREYFGKKDSYLGLQVDWGERGSFKVIGIVKDIHTSNRQLNVDFFAPFSWANPKYLNSSERYFGSTEVAILADSKDGLKKMETELRELEGTLETEPPIDRIRIFEKDATDMYAWAFLQNQDKRDGARFLYLLFGLLSVFILIPVLNLINLNITRVFERSAEIGVRKAFGAKVKDLIFQFLFENMIITFIGGVLSIFLTLIVINWLNSTDLFGSNPLMFNLPVLLVSLLTVFVFGILSGLLPALRISKTKIASALKN